MSPAYRYNAHVVSVYDGDTLRANVSLGFHAWTMNVQLRLLGINAPEMVGADKASGILSRDRLRALVADKDVVIETVKDTTEKYGRYLARVFVKIDGTWTCVNDVMINEGLAKPYMV